MVEEQLKSRGIRGERVLAAFSTVPRHLFVPEEYRVRAYEDHPLPIGSEQTISQPYMVALMIEELDVLPTSKILEVGTGSGYQTALLATLGKTVYSIERIGTLAEGARALLSDLQFQNVEIHVGDGSLGMPAVAPFDGILVSAAASQVPQALVDQLAEGGRLVIPIGSVSGQMVTVVERRHGQVEQRETVGCVFVPLVGGTS